MYGVFIAVEEAENLSSNEKSTASELEGESAEFTIGLTKKV